MPALLSGSRVHLAYYGVSVQLQCLIILFGSIFIQQPATGNIDIHQLTNESAGTVLRSITRYAGIHRVVIKPCHAFRGGTNFCTRNFIAQRRHQAAGHCSRNHFTSPYPDRVFPTACRGCAGYTLQCISDGLTMDHRDSTGPCKATNTIGIYH